MELIWIALAVGVVLMLLFLLSDRRGKNKAVKENDNEQDKNKRKKKDKGAKAKPPASSGVFAQYETYYGDYQLSRVEWLTAVLAVAAVLLLIGIVFYQNIIVSLLLSLFALFAPRFRIRQLIEQRKNELSLQFKQALYSLSSSLAAGKSLENAFREVALDLKLLYPDERTYIIQEFELINRKVENGEPIERAVENFAVRSDIEDIQNFSDVISTCKRNGGDLVEVVRRTSTIIGDKLDIQQEISVVVSQKRLESRILNIAPFVMISALALSSPDYMAPLYQFPGTGPFVMTLAIGVLIFSFWLSQKIMNIKV
ncbi:pilus assembly protein TadB [Bacillaceae bacterium SIJ1]|uniref:type II secretion system F family protein n=1 Tax=Litoribacterium kuwaitense TaxID=1398745 RepID=UPI0013EE349F|nr:type II secretion system F family protein [Litoribacterium kuwaitense]NGP44454.1 pilus assembly protein TadB [Litoribacterium kuwaitense]